MKNYQDMKTGAEILLHFFFYVLKQQSGSHLCIDSGIDPYNGALSSWWLSGLLVPNKAVKDIPPADLLHLLKGSF